MDRIRDAEAQRLHVLVQEHVELRELGVVLEDRVLAVLARVLVERDVAVGVRRGGRRPPDHATGGIAHLDHPGGSGLRVTGAVLADEPLGHESVLNLGNLAAHLGLERVYPLLGRAQTPCAGEVKGKRGARLAELVRQ